MILSKRLGLTTISIISWHFSIPLSYISPPARCSLLLGKTPPSAMHGHIDGRWHSNKKRTTERYYHESSTRNPGSTGLFHWTGYGFLRAKTPGRGYARVSTDSDDQYASYEAQVIITEYDQGKCRWEFVGIYTDEGISGYQHHSARASSGCSMMLCGQIDLIVTKRSALRSQNRG